MGRGVCEIFESIREPHILVIDFHVNIVCVEIRIERKNRFEKYVMNDEMSQSVGTLKLYLGIQHVCGGFLTST